MLGAPPATSPFPTSILLAVDGGPGTPAATHAAVAIARRHDARIAIVAPRSRAHDQLPAVLAAAALIRETVGREPIVLDERGPAPKAIAAAATEMNASLIVMGSRGLRGVAALRSVSERTVHAARCSVLVLRPGRARGA